MINPDSFSGTISHIEHGLVNRGNPSDGYTDHIYVSMDDPYVYCRWLSRGSPIIVKRKGQKCFVRNVYYDHDYQIKQLKVAVDNGGYNLYPVEFVIGPDEIHSMLIWRAGYIVKGT
jgi:hypothetical protein